MNNDTKRKRNATLKMQGQMRSERNRCPKCGRGNALRRSRDGTWIDIWCFWSTKEPPLCDYYKGYYLDDPIEDRK